LKIKSSKALRAKRKAIGEKHAQKRQNQDVELLTFPPNPATLFVRYRTITGISHDFEVEIIG
jgi:hypothetical protein